MIHSPNHYRELETIVSGHFDNMVEQTKERRVWVSRMTVEDGAPENKQVTIETVQRGVWTTLRVSSGDEWVMP